MRSSDNDLEDYRADEIEARAERRRTQCRCHFDMPGYCPGPAYCPLCQEDETP